jgi:chromate transporter
VLFVFLRSDLVTHRGWLTDAQLIDAVAVGQVTPGPVFTTATFIGFILGEFAERSFPPWAYFCPHFY